MTTHSARSAKLTEGMWGDICKTFRSACDDEDRQGLLAAAALREVHLLPEQQAALRRKLAPLSRPEAGITAISIALALRPDEVGAIPSGWVGVRVVPPHTWNYYCHAYTELNSALDRVANMLAWRFDGVAEGATVSGLVERMTHVSEYFPLCVSHRAVAEASGLGWRGHHGLIVTPEYGPALRLATVFVSGTLHSPARQLAGCGACRACLEVCPILHVGTRQPDPNAYREMCRRRIVALGLDAEVCGICVRRCWEVICQQ